MENLLVLRNFFLCHYVFKKPSAAEASESVYMRERVNLFPHSTNLEKTNFKTSGRYLRKTKFMKVSFLKTLWQKAKLIVLSNFFFYYHNVFKGIGFKNIYMWERINLKQICSKQL